MGGKMSGQRAEKRSGAFIKSDSFKVVFKYSRLSLRKKKKKISDTTVGRGEKERHENKT